MEKNYFAELIRRKEKLDSLGLQYLEQEGVTLVDGRLSQDTLDQCHKDNEDMIVDLLAEDDQEKLSKITILDDDGKPTIGRSLGYSAVARDAVVYNLWRHLQAGRPLLDLPYVAKIKLSRRYSKTAVFSTVPFMQGETDNYNRLVYHVDVNK